MSIPAPSYERLRLTVVCALSFAVSLPIALVSISKLALVCTFFWIVTALPEVRRAVFTDKLGLHRLLYAAIAMFSLSAFWSSASGAAIGKSLSQHGNLLIVPLVFFLLSTRREAVIALQVFMLGQLVLLLGSWALYLNLPVPWAQVGMASNGSLYAVFSSYLDQSIMTAVFGAMVWHLRALIPSSIRTFSVAIAVPLAMGAVFGIFIGRTGYLLAAVLASFAVYWGLPSRWRLAALFLPVLLGGLVSLVAPQARERALLIPSEVMAQAQSTSPIAAETSSGIRMNFWKSSLLALEKSPWAGHGAGSWSGQYDALQPASALPGYVPTAGNPHQEYLLWSVELGLPGLALLLSILVAAWRLSNGFEPQAQRATRSVLLAIMVACLFNCALFDALIGDFLCLALALALNLGLKSLATFRTTADN